MNPVWPTEVDWEQDLAAKIVGWLLPASLHKAIDEKTARRFLRRLSGRSDHLDLLRTTSLVASRLPQLVRFAEELLPQLCRVLPSRSVIVRRVRDGGFAGRLDIPGTTRLRIAGDVARFVVRNRSRSFDLPENVLVRAVATELCSLLAHLRTAKVLGERSWGAVARRCEGVLRVQLETTMLRDVPDRPVGPPEAAAAVAARHPAFAAAAEWHQALFAALRSTRPRDLAAVVAAGALLPLEAPARFELAVLVRLLEAIHGRLEPLGFHLERSLVLSRRSEVARLHRGDDEVLIFYNQTPPGEPGAHDRGAHHYLARSGRMRPDVTVIVRRKKQMIGGTVIEVKLTMDPAYAQQGYSEAIVYAHEYPEFLTGWPKAILVTTADVPGEVRASDDIIAVGWSNWAPPAVVEGVIAPLLVA